MRTSRLDLTQALDRHRRGHKPFLKGLTARYLLKEVLELRPGDTVLYHAGAGGVGQIFVQRAKALGLKVIGTVSSDAKAKLARHAGCDHVINYSSEDFVAEALAFTAGNGVAAVFNSVGADTFRGSLAVLRPRGTLVQFGKASGSPEPVDPFELAPRALYLTWPILPHYTSTAGDLAIAAADLFDAIATGILKITHGLWEWFPHNPDRLRAYSYRPVVSFDEPNLSFQKIIDTAERVSEVSYELSHANPTPSSEQLERIQLRHLKAHGFAYWSRRGLLTMMKRDHACLVPSSRSRRPVARKLYGA